MPASHPLPKFKLMGWMAPSRQLCAKMVVVEDHQQREPSMGEITIGIDKRWQTGSHPHMGRYLARPNSAFAANHWIRIALDDPDPALHYLRPKRRSH